MDIRVGDKVRYTGESGYDMTHGNVYEFIGMDRDEWANIIDDVGDEHTLPIFRFEPVTDAPHMTLPNGDVPTLWRYMTDAEKGALLLAHHDGKEIEAQCYRHEGWYDATPSWRDDIAYRIKPEPKVEAVELHGQKYVTRTYPNGVWDFDRNVRQDGDTHRITFNVIDGKPDCGSIKMEKL